MKICHCLIVLAAGMCGTTATLAQDAAPMTSGWDKGRFFVGDAGVNRLNVGGKLQFRYYGNFNDTGVSSNDFANGFQVRRAEVQFDGTIWSKDLSYKVKFDMGGAGSAILKDAFFVYNYGNGFSVRGGQGKLSLLREELVGDEKTLAVDRSVVHMVFTQDRSQLIGVVYSAKTWRAMAEFSDGLKTSNTDFTSASEGDYALTGRVEVLAAGDDFKRFDDFTSWKGSPFACMLGAAGHYQSGGDTLGTPDMTLFEATADASLEGNGWNAYVAGVWRNRDTASAASTDDFGVVAQAGVFLSDQFEVFGRYDGVFADSANGHDFHTATAGFNYYVAPQSHAAKATVDVCYFFDDTAGSPLVTPSSNLGMVSSTKDGEVVVRGQFQLLF